MSTWRIASVPPVEAPIAINFSVVEKTGLKRRGVSPLSAAGRGLGRDLAATRIFSAIRSLYSTKPSRKPSLGLVTKSTAPNSSARIVTSELRSVSDDTITTGIGRNRIKRSRKSSPSIRGISTSSVRTSGLCCLIKSRATKGSGATATTSISGCPLMISFIKPRTNAESSTHKTRILLIQLPFSFKHPKTVP